MDKLKTKQEIMDYVAKQNEYRKAYQALPVSEREKLKKEYCRLADEASDSSNMDEDYHKECVEKYEEFDKKYPFIGYILYYRSNW